MKEDSRSLLKSYSIRLRLAKALRSGSRSKVTASVESRDFPRNLTPESPDSYWGILDAPWNNAVTTL
jgi:hypothetical protein